MKQLLSGLVLVASLSLIAAQQSAAVKNKAPAVSADQGPRAIRFNTAPSTFVGATGDTLAVAATKDGKRIATVGGSFNPAIGFVSVIDLESKKELLSLRFPRAYSSVGISPDGKLVALANATADLKLLEVDTGKTLFSKKLDGAAEVAFAPDGLSLVTVTNAKTVQIWDVPSGDEQSKISGATVPLRSIAFSFDGRKLAAGGGEARKKGMANGTVFVWDLATQRLLKKLEMTDPSSVTSVAFSGDGKLLAGASIDGEVRIWNVADGTVKASISAEQQLFGLGFWPGQLLAGAMGDGSIQLWDPATGEEKGILGRHSGACRCVSFIGKGEKLVSGGNGRSLKLWDVAGKKELATLHQAERFDDLPLPVTMAATGDGSTIAIATEDGGVLLRDGRTGDIASTVKLHEETVTSLAFSPDGKTLATGSTDKTIKLVETATGKDRATLKGHTNWIYALAFSHDGKTLASGAYDKTVRLWDVETGKEVATIEAHRGSVRAIAFSPDDKTLASGGSDRSVKLWNVADRELKITVKGHDSAVRALAFSPGGNVLTSGDENGNVKLWNQATGKELAATKKTHRDLVTAIAFAGDRTVLSGAADGQIIQWDAASGEMMGVLPGHSGGVVGIAVAADGNEFVSAGMDRAIKRFHRDSAGPSYLFAGHTGVIQSVAFSPDGRKFVSCGNWPEGDKTLRVWDLEQKKEILTIEHPDQAPMAIFSPNGRFIASTCGNKNAYLWDAETGNPIRTFKGHTGGVQGIAFSANGTRILTSGSDKTARLWDTNTGNELQQFTGHTDLIRRVQFHPDGTHALSAGRDGLVRMWELDTAKEVKQFKSGGNWADCLAVSKDGKYLATGGQTINVYEIASGRLLSACTGHGSGANHVAFTDDGKRLVSTSHDRSARLWDRDTGRELYRFLDHREMLFAAAVSPDGNWLLTGGGGVSLGNNQWDKGTDHAVRLWKMPDERMLSEFYPDR